MSAETAIAVGVSTRVLANIACASNPRLGAAVVGCGTGFVLHQTWVKNTIQDPIIFLVIGLGLVFDHYFFGGFEATITLLLSCGLGVVLADFGPDLLYEVLGEQYVRELENLIPFFGDEPVSDYDYDDGGSVVSKTSSHSHRTSRSGRTGTSVTARPSRPRVVTGPGSSITRSSRVTFDESSMAQSQSEDDYEVGTNGDGLYMEPSSMASGSARTRVTMRPPSILRRMSMPAPTTATTTTTSRPSELSHGSRLSSESEMTARGPPEPLGESSQFSSEYQPPSIPFPEPEPARHQIYSPQIVPPSTTTPSVTNEQLSSEPMQYIPNEDFEHVESHSSHEPSLLQRMMQVPIVDPHTHADEHTQLLESPYEASHSRESSSVRPESILSPRVETPDTALQETIENAWVTVPEPYVRDDYQDRVVDVRKLDRESAMRRIEEAWKTVEDKKLRRLNVRVAHDDDIQAGSVNNFQFMEDLERARFNFKQRPGLFIITSRSRH